jgi:TRAP transporter TAXI family solute receptor
MGMGCLEYAQQWFSVPAGVVFAGQVIENQLFLTDTRAGRSVIKVCSRSIAAALVLTGACFGASPGGAIAKDKFVALGTGSPNGTYAPVGSGICDLVNEGRANTGVRCIAYNTGGSVYNIQAITSGELEMGITRSDLAYQSYEGIDSFKAIGPNRDIRAITTLYAMPIAVVVKNDAGIEKFADMVGKRINIGNKGSGKRSVADLILGQMGWQRGDFSAILELTTTQMGKAFCDGNVDILIEGLGNPSQFYEKMVGECGGKFLAVPDEVVAKIRKMFPVSAHGTY